MDYNEELEKFLNLFQEKIEKTFHKITARNETIEERIPTKFGYKKVERVITYNFVFHQFKTIKWGFNKEHGIVDPQSFEIVGYALPDEEAMEENVLSFLENKETYINTEISKLALEAYDGFSGEIDISTKIDDGCVSPKGNCVSFIRVIPTIRMGRIV